MKVVLNPNLKRQKHATKHPVTLSVVSVTDSISPPCVGAHTTIHARARCARTLSFPSILSFLLFSSLLSLLSLLSPLPPLSPLSSLLLLFLSLLLSSSLLLSPLPSPPGAGAPSWAPHPTLDAPILSRKTLRISPFPPSFPPSSSPSFLLPFFPPSLPLLGPANFKTQPPAPKKSLFPPVRAPLWSLSAFWPNGNCDSITDGVFISRRAIHLQGRGCSNAALNPFRFTNYRALPAMSTQVWPPAVPF